MRRRLRSRPVPTSMGLDSGCAWLSGAAVLALLVVGGHTLSATAAWAAVGLLCGALVVRPRAPLKLEAGVGYAPRVRVTRALALATVAPLGLLLGVSGPPYPQLLAGLLVSATVAIALDAWARLGSASAPVRVVVVGSHASALRLEWTLRRLRARRYQLVGWVATEDDSVVVESGAPALGSVARLPEIVAAEGIDVVVCAGGVQTAVAGSTGVHICDLVRFCEEALGHIPIVETGPEWFHRTAAGKLAGGSAMAKRAVDLVVAGIAVVVALPLFAVLACLIRRDGGPVLFRQIRVGRNGRPFAMFKLRTMHAESLDPRWSFVDDPRVTGLGRVLRRTHIDELPQLVNVLMGEMSLVGPRPEQPHYVETLGRSVSGYWLRHRAKPGMTGWAQVRCGYASSSEDSVWKLCHDLYYLEHRSLRLDAMILTKTVGLLSRSVVSESAHRLRETAIGPIDGEPELSSLVSRQESE